MTQELSERLAALAAPLQEERDALEVRVRETEEQLAALRDDRNRLDQILRRLNGTPAKTGPKPKPASLHSPATDETIGKVREYLAAHPEVADDFNAGTLHTEMEATGVAFGARETTRRVVLTMHDRGELQFLKSGRGGSRQYRYLGARENG